jgi:SNF2 family DNA or RNA helicase
MFSQFTSLLALAREALGAANIRQLYLDGQTPERERWSLVDAFQTGDCDAFLISLKAGGTGLNLTAADNVIHLDPWWNPAVEDQASDRAHRLGQTRPVTIYKLVATGTIEDKILTMHEEKRALVAGMLDGAATPSTLSTQDLLALVVDDPSAAGRGASVAAKAKGPRPRRGVASGPCGGGVTL